MNLNDFTEILWWEIIFHARWISKVSGHSRKTVLNKYNVQYYFII
jgi:hypothetical protein